VRIQSFSAPTLSAGYARIREQFGADAVVLSAEPAAGEILFTVSTAPPAASASQAGEEAVRSAARVMMRNAGFQGAVLSQFETYGRERPAEDPRRLIDEFLYSAIRVESLVDLGKTSPVLVFIGPPGAGKTATVAKAASTFVSAGGRVTLVNLDQHRLGGGSQLEHLAAVLGVPVINAARPEGLKAGLNSSARPEIVLCDAPGIHPWNLEDIESAVRYAEKLGGLSVLVCPAGLEAAETADLLAIVKRFGVDRIVVTKCDITRKLGALLTAVILEKYVLLGLQRSRRLSEPVSLASAGAFLAALQVRAPRER
jgi:flagellar biosynthesis protein FlhF